MRLKEFYQRGKQGYTNTDKWNYWCWLAEMTNKILSDIEPNIVGCPELDFDEDINKMPVDWVALAAAHIDSEDGADEYDEQFRKWKLILLRIAYCFKMQDENIEGKPEYQDLYNEYADLWHYQVSKGGKSILELSEKDPDNEHLFTINFGKANDDIEEKFWQREEEISKFKSERKDEAFDLLKKYFYHLWD